MNLGAYWFSDRIVLRMYRAQEVGPADAPGLYSLVRELSMRANLPAPRVFVIPDDSPNAFATGRSPEKGVVAVTRGLLQALNRDELAGVIAHELAHIKNRDTLVMSIAATVGGSLSMLAELTFWSMLFGGSESEEGDAAGGLAGIILAPVAALLVQMAISRTREYEADATAARITGQPMALASALQKIARIGRQVPMETGSAGAAHLLISNPFRVEALSRLLSTHPPVEKRVERLRSLATGFHLVAA
jgi:heat shock protein HtpX